MKKFILFLATFGFISFIISQSVFASSFYPKGATGVDISYPNCSSSIPKTNFGIVGVNNGLVYSSNPCFLTEAKKFNNLSLYVNTGLNSYLSSSYYLSVYNECNGDKMCAAYKYGFNAGMYALNYAKNQGVNTDKWWLDVETMNIWSSNTAENQQSLQGTYDAIATTNPTLIGAYSTTAQWQTITGGWKNNWPSWGATTWSTASLQ